MIDFVTVYILIGAVMSLWFMNDKKFVDMTVANRLVNHLLFTLIWPFVIIGGIALAFHDSKGENR